MWSEMNRLQGEMNRLFGRYGVSNGPEGTAAGYPAFDLWEDEDNLYVEAELPGMELSDLEIFVNGDDQLSIKGERKPPEIEKASWHRRERSFGSFSRLMTLPQNVDAENVQAEFKNGVLTISMPKKEESKPRRIQVKVD
jgi:HSP20 family protein